MSALALRCAHPFSERTEAVTDVVDQALKPSPYDDVRWVKDSFRDLNARRAARGLPAIEPLEHNPTARLTQVVLQVGEP